MKFMCYDYSMNDFIWTTIWMVRFSRVIYFIRANNLIYSVLIISITQHLTSHEPSRRASENVLGWHLACRQKRRFRNARPRTAMKMANEPADCSPLSGSQNQPLGRPARVTDGRMLGSIWVWIFKLARMNSQYERHGRRLRAKSTSDQQRDCRGLRFFITDIVSVTKEDHKLAAEAIRPKGSTLFIELRLLLKPIDC